MTTRIQRRLLAKANASQPSVLAKVPQHEWPEFRPAGLVEVWRSRAFLAQIYTEPAGFERMSVCRTAHNGTTWVDQISWEEMMQLKRECGRGQMDAVEVFPADDDIVNVANMRHLFFPPEVLSFKWKAS
jgi:hypothetical protein